MKILLGLFMASLLLLAGCPQESTGAPSGAQDNGSAPQQGGGESSQQGAALDNGSLPPQGSEPGSSSPPEAQPQGSASGGEAGGDFGSWDLEEMMLGGQEIHCTVRYEDGYVSTESELYIKGDSMRAVAHSTVEGEMLDTVMIMVGNVSYISVGADEYGLGEDCEWIMMDFGRLQECLPESVLEDAEESTGEFSFEGEYEDSPAEFTCEYSSFGDAIFAPDGKVCDFTEDLCAIYEMIETQGT